MGFSDTGRPWQDVVEDLTQRILPNSMNMAHPRFFGFIPSAPLPSAWLVDAIVSAYNPFSGSWLQGSGPAAIELATIDLLRRQVGLPETAGGVFLSGGSIANMTALTAARTGRLSQDAWPDAIAYVTSEAHSSVRKGLRFIGVPDANVRTIAVDDGRPDDRARAPRPPSSRDLREGRHPFAVTATFGTTNTGAIDPIAEIAEVRFAVRGSGCTSTARTARRSRSRPATATRPATLEFADSLSWDPHKWLFQTYVSSCLLVRDRRSLLDCFRTQADYLRDAEADPRKPNYWDYGPEMTRPARAVRLWATLQVLGRRELAAAIDHCVALAEVAADRLGALPDWRVTSPPQLGILTFRYAPEGYPAEELDAVNAAVSRTGLRERFRGGADDPAQRSHGAAPLHVQSEHDAGARSGDHRTARRGGQGGSLPRLGACAVGVSRQRNSERDRQVALARTSGRSPAPAGSGPRAFEPVLVAERSSTSTPG